MSTVTDPSLLFVVNSARFFRSHRLPLAVEADRRGWTAAVVCGANSGEEALEALGVRVITVPLARSGLDPFAEWSLYRRLSQIYRDRRPTIVHHITIKPVIYGSWAAARRRVPVVINAVPGLGWIYTAEGPWSRLRRTFVDLLYRSTRLHRRMHFIFQNEDDRREFVSAIGVPPATTHLVRGSGVDLSEFVPVPEFPGPMTFALVARMLFDKGVGEFVAAARQLKRRHSDWRFLLIGDVDAGNRSSLSAGELRAWQDEGVIEWLGHRDDIAWQMAAAHVICLPSYREGLPKTLIEAAAAGRPAIASDVPGCREVVRDQVTGLLVPPRTVAPLVDAMSRLGGDAGLRARMGEAARRSIEHGYSVDDVVKETFLVYERALES